MRLSGSQDDQGRGGPDNQAQAAAAAFAAVRAAAAQAAADRRAREGESSSPAGEHDALLSPGMRKALLVAAALVLAALIAVAALAVTSVASAPTSGTVVGKEDITAHREAIRPRPSSDPRYRTVGQCYRVSFTNEAKADTVVSTCVARGVYDSLAVGEVYDGERGC